MLIRIKTLLMAIVIASVVVNSVLASGSRSTESSGVFSSGSARSAEDITYEHGKSLFKGRDRRYGKVKYCVPTDNNELKKVKGSSLKPYKNGASEALANDLFNCDNPNQRIAQVFTTTDMTALVYYLNKRHKLSLN